MVNPYNGGLPDLKVGSNYFRVGDKIMQNKNNDKASNGDIGFIRDIGVNEKSETIITIEFSAERKVEYTIEDMKNIELAYATTIHKAMGSEYDIVIMPIIKSHYNMLKRNLVYTGITRAKSRVILIGQIGMLCMAIHRNETGNRNTALGLRIANYKKVYDIEKEKNIAS
ncbi:MAG: ATP-binding domain-containing protein, partial [Clostridia bacterium]|nr:ATP-binding domain-containing protein [Clostridia bacterium]